MSRRREFVDDTYKRPLYPSSPSYSSRSRFSLPLARARVHPFLLVPVFLFGLAFTRFYSRGTLPNPVYHGDTYNDEDTYQPFLPPDAPPLNPFEEEDMRREERGRAGGRPRGSRGMGGDLDDWDDDSDADANTAGTTRPPYFTSLDGYLYYPSSAPLVPMDIPVLTRVFTSSTPFDSLLVLPVKAAAVAAPAFPPPIRGRHGVKAEPPPPIPDWVHPNARFKAPLPPPPPSTPPPTRPGLPGFPPRNRVPAMNPVAKGLPAQPPPRRLGRNAEEMRLAELEGRPFKPAKPIDFQLQERANAIEARRKAAAEKAQAQELQELRDGVRRPVFAPDRRPVPPPVGEPARAVLGTDDEAEKRRQLVRDQRVARKQNDLAKGAGGKAAEVKAPAAAPDVARPQGGRLAPKVPPAVVAAAKAIPDPPIELVLHEVAVPPSADDLAALFADEEHVGDDGTPLTPEEVEQEDHELLLLFEDLTDEERMLLTPDELAVFMEIENRLGGGHRFHIDEDDVEPPARLRKRGFDLEEDLPPDEVVADSVAPADGEVPLERREAVASTSKDRLHPIAQLIKEADEKWDTMLESQSQTLFQAVVEYERRYSRKPPLGFDSWWRYAMQNRVILVDEYDQIDEDIRPFFSLPASEIRSRAKALATDARLPHHTNSFTVSVKDGKVTASGPHEKSSRAEDTLDLIGEFSETLPDLTMTFASHELPVIAISGEARIRHEHYARHGLVLDDKQRNEILENTGYLPWQGLCRPNTTSRRVADGLGTGRPQSPSFVSTEHVNAMDVCLHPEIQHLNGFTAWEGPRPYLLYPLFSWAKTSMHGDLLSAPMTHYYSETGVVPEWEAKTKNKVLWRGETTGAYFRRGSGWRSTQRSRLVLLTSDRDGEREVRFADPKANDAVRRFTGPTANINDFYFDVGFSGLPVQCDSIDETCELMVKELRFLPMMSPTQANLYKYALDVDANGASGDFHRLLQSGTVVFKSTIFPEWYTRRVVPWYHYVPIKSDYADLTDAAAFFIGAPDGTGSHDDLAKKIAENGKKYAKEHWREADMAAYQFRLYLEYARLISREQEGSHDFILDT